ncbi:Hypothetical protein R9X50_00602400 [Acrodontium crateriforme]|uniref:Uncharacterized protein n=1 Tax=Acrodontium crateriforme TaxID=150365 RepID=A0AAQ3RDG2_9PEZI|nr:Hypothetical protein R9X50_00602400 [Acrodontium crateriforme]
MEAANSGASHRVTRRVYKRRRPLATIQPDNSSQASSTPLYQASARRENKPELFQYPASLPQSDSKETQELWKTVQSFNAHRQRSARMSPKYSGVKVGGRDIRKRNTPSEPSDSHVPIRSATETESIAPSTARSRTTGPHQRRFPEEVLEPRGIFLDDTKAKSKPPYNHFSSVVPKDLDYARDSALAHAGIWIPHDEASFSAISNHYAFMEKMHLSEDQFGTYGKQQFFLSERWQLNLPNNRKWRGERIDQHVNPANPTERWLAPPVLDMATETTDGYRWDVRPDSSYWISNRGFNEEYAEAIPGCCYVYRDWISNPYLTIEFKKNDWRQGTAAIQVLTAGSIALHNRVILHLQAVNEPEDIDEIKHFGLTFEGPHYVVYVLRLNKAEREAAVGKRRIPESLPGGAEIANYWMWSGCTMSRLAQGDCTKYGDVPRLVRWINEIHRWGLTKHAIQVQNDIKMVLANDGFDVSIID